MRVLESFWQDIRYGARVLRRSPGFAIVALLSLTLGIGANGAIFQLLDIVRLRTLPVHDPHAIVEVRIAPSPRGRTGAFIGARPALTNPLWEQIRDRQQSLSEIFAYGNASFDLSAGGESRIAQGMFVSGAYFRALEARPAAGRLFEPADDVRGCAAPGAVVSHAFWQREYAGAREVVGRQIRLDGQSFPIVGVIARGFSTMEIGRRIDVFMPICSRPLIKRTQPGIDQRDVWWLAAFGRLKAGTTVEQASAELASRSRAIMAATVSPTYAAVDAKGYSELQLQAYPAATGVSGLRARYATSLTLLLSIAGLVLLIACANLANLMLARASARAREIAVRLAIGASRGRVFRQLFAESLLLAVLGGIAGIWLALGLSRLLVALLTSDGGPWTLDLTLDWRLVGFTMALAIVTCVLFGLTPALRATRTPPGAVLKLGGRGLTADRGRFLLRRVLVIGQVAVSLVLVVGALLFVGTLRNLAASDSGYSHEHVLVLDLDLRPAGVPAEGLRAFHADLMDRLRAVPGVVRAGAAAIAPLSGSGWNETILVDGKTQDGHPNANRVSADFFEALGVPFVRGRNFDSRDRFEAPPVAIVNEAFAAKYLGGSDPIGRAFRIQVGPGQPDLSYEVIGVVRNTKYRELREELGPIMFFADTQEPEPSPFLTVLLRSTADVATLRANLTRAVAGAHPAMSVSLDPMSTQLHNWLLRERLMAALSAGFAVLAVVLAAVGLYGLLSYGVARRRSEIGIRLALGATRWGIVSMIVREMTVLVIVGVGVGLGLAIWSGRAAQALLFGLTPGDPWTLGLGVAALVAVAAMASVIPAQRAARLEPTSALREDA
jgi:putative ABC transport system permease protein